MRTSRGVASDRPDPDLTVFNVTKEADVAHQAEAVAQAFAVPGVPTIKPTFGERPTPPEWWNDAIMLEDAPAPV
jgi:ribonuclease Z